MHFLHKTYPGTSDNISHCSKFQNSGCLISWLPKFRSCDLANWLFTFFSQNSALLNLNLYSSQNVYQAATSPTTLWCAWHVSGVPDTSLVSLACHWCHIHFSWVPDIYLVSASKHRSMWQLSSVPDALVVSLRHQRPLLNVSCDPDTPMVSMISFLSPTSMRSFWLICDVPDTSVISLLCMYCP